ncbi:MAG: ribonuclease R, partial [Leptospiraceae bacterium]|nr:ribonuclease R [Leptospiraceae bacterium]
SPIRRYPDLVVHRVLSSLVYRNKLPYDDATVQDLGHHCSEKERLAMDAEREIHKLKLIRYLEQSGQSHFKATVSHFKPDRVFLELNEFPGEAVVLAQHLTKEATLPTGDPFSVFIRRLGQPARIGDVWQLELDRLDAEDMVIYCRPVFE